MDMPTPSPSQIMANMTPEQLTSMRLQQEIDFRNRPLTDADLDEMLPGESEGYEVLVVLSFTVLFYIFILFASEKNVIIVFANFPIYVLDFLGASGGL
jgi:hypothetical protein